MLPEIESLLVLQDRDQRIRSLEEDMKRIPSSKEQAKERLANDIALVANAKKAVQDNEVAIKNLFLARADFRATPAKCRPNPYASPESGFFPLTGITIFRS